VTLKKGDVITIDGAEGEVLSGAVEDASSPSCPAISATLMVWADELRRMKVRANAETPLDAAHGARKFGAEGIGLCRTEHMFFDAERIVAVREMILADVRVGAGARWPKLLPMQRADFAAIFRRSWRACR